MDIEKLEKAGLREKEAAVYVALLSLGPSPVQVIARRAKIARGTAYVVLESLQRRGLVVAQIFRHRRVFKAQKPEQLLAILEEQQRMLKKNAEEMHEILPRLNALMPVQESRPLTSYYEGEAGLRFIRQEMVKYCGKGDVWYNISPIDQIKRIFGDEGVVCTSRIQKGILSRTICLTASASLRDILTRQSRQHRVERKFATQFDEGQECGLTIFRDRLAIGWFGEKPGGMIIESRSLSSMLRKFFDLTWEAL